MRPKFNLEACIDRGSVLMERRESSCPIRLSAALDCPRKLALRAIRAPEQQIDGEAARIFKAGRDRGAAHVEALQALFNDEPTRAPRVYAAEPSVWLNVNLADEVAIRAERVLRERFGEGLDGLPFEYTPEAGARVRGRIDAVLIHESRYTIIDFKTAGEYGFDKIDEADWTTANETYLGQLGAYCKAFIETYNLDALTDPCLVFEHKDTGKLKVLWVPLATALEYGNAAKKNLERVLCAIAEGTETTVPPGFLPDKSGRLPFNCEYCSVSATCWRGRGLREVVIPRKRRPALYVDMPASARSSGVTSEE